MRPFLSNTYVREERPLFHPLCNFSVEFDARALFAPITCITGGGGFAIKKIENTPFEVFLIHIYIIIIHMP